MYLGVFERLKLVQNGSILNVWNASNKRCFHINLYIGIWFAKIRAENGGIFQSHLDGSQKHIELGRIRDSYFRLAIEEMFD
jgi:hypothetical protein